MTFLERLKSILGLGDGDRDRDGDGDGRREDRDVGPTVERDPDAVPATEREATIKGVTGETDGRATGETGGIATAAKTRGRVNEDAPDSTSDPDERTVGTDDTTPDRSTDGETGEDAGADRDESAETGPDVEADDLDSDSDSEPVQSDEAEAGDGNDDRVPSEAVDVIKGIGPTYAGRLSGAGVETVADLAEVDAESVVEEADVPEGRLIEWIERAKNRRR